MAILGFAAAWVAASVGISLSMAWNVPNQLPSKQLKLSAQTMEKKDTNIHKHSQIGGYCEGIGKGTIRVGLMVGDCGHGYKSGYNAYTGYVSTTRIVIEEVPPPQ